MHPVGVTGTKQQNRASLKQIKLHARKFRAVSTGTHLGKRWAENRFRFPYLREALWEQGYSVDTLETATCWSNVNRLQSAMEKSLTDTAAAADKNIHVFTHLSHVYAQGCSLYTTYIFKNSNTYAETLSHWKDLKHHVSQTVVNTGGTISHQHGVGKDHAPYLPVEKGSLGMAVIQKLSEHFDPKGRLNPGTLIEPTETTLKDEPVGNSAVVNNTVVNTNE